MTSADAGADLAGLAGRRRLLLSGFAVLALVLLAGSYFILRSISREHAVARLQSEFVSAVSHEFRTPLTSLRQLSDMLSKGRVPTEELRQESYDILSRESERLQRLVESLLEFGRMEARAFRYRSRISIRRRWSATWWPNSRRRPPPRATASNSRATGSTRASAPTARRSAWRCGTCSTTR